MVYLSGSGPLNPPKPVDHLILSLCMYSMCLQSMSTLYECKECYADVALSMHCMVHK